RHRDHAQDAERDDADDDPDPRLDLTRHHCPGGFAPPDPPTLALARRFAGALRARGSLAVARSLIGVYRSFFASVTQMGSPALPQTSIAVSASRRTVAASLRCSASRASSTCARPWTHGIEVGTIAASRSARASSRRRSATRA